mmetsp:Transcript_27380/g.84893  ORF Transcript_27380/g.84893 Transcript_27380/m.84893 type:complete len:415 (+) Transcript_27380:1154-2398(+)
MQVDESGRDLPRVSGQIKDVELSRARAIGPHAADGAAVDVVEDEEHGVVVRVVDHLVQGDDVAVPESLHHVHLPCDIGEAPTAGCVERRPVGWALDGLDGAQLVLLRVHREEHLALRALAQPIEQHVLVDVAERAVVVVVGNAAVARKAVSVAVKIQVPVAGEPRRLRDLARRARARGVRVVEHADEADGAEHAAPVVERRLEVREARSGLVRQRDRCAFGRSHIRTLPVRLQSWHRRPRWLDVTVFVAADGATLSPHVALPGSDERAVDGGALPADAAAVVVLRRAPGACRTRCRGKNKAEQRSERVLTRAFSVVRVCRVREGQRGTSDGRRRVVAVLGRRKCLADGVPVRNTKRRQPARQQVMFLVLDRSGDAGACSHHLSIRGVWWRMRVAQGIGSSFGGLFVVFLASGRE